MYRTGCNAYQHSATNTVEDKNLILLKLYEGAVCFLRRAQTGIMENRPNVRGENLSRVMAIITELDCALDMEKGGQISQQLASLYRYMMDRLTTANSTNSLIAAKEVEGILLTLKEGFEGAVQQQQTAKAPAAVPNQNPISREALRCAI